MVNKFLIFLRYLFGELMIIAVVSEQIAVASDQIVVPLDQIGRASDQIVVPSDQIVFLIIIKNAITLNTRGLDCK